VNDLALEPLLQIIIRREGRSLLQYAGDAFPWTTPAHQPALAELRRMIQEDNEAIDALARYLRKRRMTPPYLGAYPMSFTGYGFVGLDHLLPLLVVYQRRSIADLERDLARLDDAGARAEVQKLLDLKQRHLKQLEELAAGKTAATAAH
jgi:hypothetical protein